VKPWVRRVLVVFAQLATVAAVLALWQSVTDSQALNFSRPSSVARALGHWLGNASLRTDIYTTLEEAAIGLGVAIVLAVVFASLLTLNKAVAATLDPFVSVLNAIPKIALAPLFLLVFGIGFREKVYFVAAAVFFIPFYSLYLALRTIDPVYLDNIRSLGASRWWMIWDVYVPAVIGSTAASLRVGSAIAIVSAVIGELVTSASNGIGLEILQAQSNQQPNYLVAGVLIVSVIAFAFDRLFWMIDRRVSSWRIAK
jgi:NitT/TauT family transport system permease protein